MEVLTVLLVWLVIIIISIIFIALTAGKDKEKTKIDRKFHKVIIQNSEGNLETGYACPYLPSGRYQDQIFNFTAKNGTFWYILCYIYKGKNKEDEIERLLFYRIRDWSNIPLSRDEIEKELNT